MRTREILRRVGLAIAALKADLSDLPPLEQRRIAEQAAVDLVTNMDRHFPREAPAAPPPPTSTEAADAALITQAEEYRVAFTDGTQPYETRSTVAECEALIERDGRPGLLIERRTRVTQTSPWSPVATPRRPSPDAQ